MAMWIIGRAKGISSQTDKSVTSSIPIVVHRGSGMLLLAALLVFCSYIFAAGPTFYWLDSGEFVAAAWGLGIAHPPGHALPSLIARLFCYLPIGTISFRVTLASAFEAALATWCIGKIAEYAVASISGQYHAAVHTNLAPHATSRTEAELSLGSPVALFSSNGPGNGLSATQTDVSQGSSADLGCADISLTSVPRLLCAAAAIVAGWCYAVAFQAVRAEVYALNLLLISAIFVLLLYWKKHGDRRALLTAALLCGLALCNHHFLVILAMPAMVLFVFYVQPAWWRQRRVLLGVVLAVALGLSVLVYLPLRAARAPVVDWGHPTTVSRFYWVVSAKLFQRTVDRAKAQPLSDRSQQAVFAALGSIGPVAAIIGLAGLYLLWRRRAGRPLALLLTAGIAGNLTTPLWIGFDPNNPDAYGYLAVSVACLAPGIAVLFSIVFEALHATALRRFAAALCVLLSLFFITTQLYAHFPRWDLRRHWAAEEAGRAVLDAPPGALILSAYHETLFNTWALRVAGDLRPDIDMLQRTFLGMTGYREQLAALRHTTWTKHALQWPTPSAVAMNDIAQVAQTRSIYFEYDDKTFPSPWLPYFHIDGLLLRYEAKPRATTTSPPRSEALFQTISGYDLESRRAITWAHYGLAHFACRAGYFAQAHWHLQQALTQMPESTELKRLRQQCYLRLNNR